MMKDLAFVFLALVAVSQVKANNPFENGIQKLELISKSIKSEAQAVETSLGPSIARFDRAMKHGLRVGQEGVKNVYNRAIQNLDNIPEQCQQGIKNSILQLQSDADNTFLACSNLTLAVQDLGNLVTYTGTLLLKVARSLQELTWFTNCFSWNPIKSLPCFFEWIGLLYQGTRGLIGGLSEFNTELDSTLLHMLKVVEYCQARTTNQHSVITLMTPVHECANQPIPHHLYTVQN